METNEIYTRFREIIHGYSFSENDLNTSARLWFTSGEKSSILAAGININRSVREVVHEIMQFITEHQPQILYKS